MWGDLGKIIVATSFEWLPKAQKIAQSGHTAVRMGRVESYYRPQSPNNLRQTKMKIMSSSDYIKNNSSQSTKSCVI